MGKPILVAVDGSDHARRAVERGLELASDRGVPLHVITVVDRRIRSEPALSSGELVTIASEDRCRDLQTVVERDAARSGVECHCEVCHGLPHERVLEYADEIGAASVLVGVHGDRDSHLGGVGRKLREASDYDVRVIGPDG